MLDLLIYLGVAYFVIRSVTILLFRSMENNETKQRMMEHADRMIRIVQLEPLPEHGTILAYDKENNQFLGQGASERFPEKIFLLNDKAFTAKDDVKVKIEKIECTEAR
jgi:hypothetical protein